MKTKKIIADSMPLALKKVRQELGENAIIINTRTIKTGGMFGLFSKQKFEVTAYSVEEGPKPQISQFKVEPEEKIINTPSPQEKSAASKQEEADSPDPTGSGFHKQPQKLYSYYSQPSSQKEQPAPVPVSAPVPAQVAAPTAEPDNPLLEELQHLQKMMMTFMMSDKQKSELPPGVNKWVDRLKDQGVDDEVIFHIVNQFFKKEKSPTDMDNNAIKQEIAAIIEEIITSRTDEVSRVNDRTSVINMIGPTGVGKTTTIAKLATEQILKQKRRVAMITADVYRIAAVEQLKTYAGILNVPIEVVRSKEELESVLEKLRHYDIIYMDTTGRNYKDSENREAINEFLNLPLESENYLVLSLTTKFDDLKILLDEFLESPVQKLILTKMDETASYGSILNIAYKYPYQIAYITNGQSVPEDITTINAASLASYLLGEENEDGSSTKSS